MISVLIIDRIEDDFAVIENNKKRFNVRRQMLPADAKEGDVIVMTAGRYIIDKVSTQKQKNKNRNLENSLWKR